MNGLKKQLFKRFIKLDVVKNEPGLLILHMAKLSQLDKKFKIYDRYIIEAIKLLNGVEEIRIDYEQNNITINYNQQKITAQKIYNWIQVILDVALDNIDFIEKYGETDTEYTVQKLEEVLKQKIKLFNTSN